MMMQSHGSMQGMHGGMMHEATCPMCGMVSDQKMPMKKYQELVKHLPEMQEELSLLEDQVNKLIDLRAQYKKQQIDYQAVLDKERMKTEKILHEMPSASELKEQLKKCSDIRVNMKVEAYETAKQMKGLLTEEQKESLKNSYLMQGGMMQGGMMH